MRIIILAFIISISLHFFLFNEYKNKKISEKQEIKEEKNTQTDVKFVKIKKEEAPIINKPIEKKVEKKVEPKIEKKVELPIQKKEIQQKIDIPKKVDIEKSKELQKKVLKEQIVEKKESLQDKTLENFLAQKEPVNKEILNELDRKSTRLNSSHT